VIELARCSGWRARKSRNGWSSRSAPQRGRCSCASRRYIEHQARGRQPPLASISPNPKLSGDPTRGCHRIPDVRIKSITTPAGAAVLVALVALALADSRGGPTGGPSSAVVTTGAAHLRIVNYAFVPSTLTVRAGTTITVTNADSTSHTATASSGAFDSGTLKPGQSARFALRKPGTYAYFCQFHAFMTGTIKVVR
jgi:plastocyanin